VCHSVALSGSPQVPRKSLPFVRQPILTIWHTPNCFRQFNSSLLRPKVKVDTAMTLLIGVYGNRCETWQILCVSRYYATAHCSRKNKIPSGALTLGLITKYHCLLMVLWFSDKNVAFIVCLIVIGIKWANLNSACRITQLVINCCILCALLANNYKTKWRLTKQGK